MGVHHCVCMLHSFKGQKVIWKLETLTSYLRLLVHFGWFCAMTVLPSSLSSVASLTSSFVPTPFQCHHVLLSVACSKKPQVSSCFELQQYIYFNLPPTPPMDSSSTFLSSFSFDKITNCVKCDEEIHSSILTSILCFNNAFFCTRINQYFSTVCF